MAIAAVIGYQYKGPTKAPSVAPVAAVSAPAATTPQAPAAGPSIVKIEGPIRIEGPIKIDGVVPVEVVKMPEISVSRSEPVAPVAAAPAAVTPQTTKVADCATPAQVAKPVAAVKKAATKVAAAQKAVVPSMTMVSDGSKRFPPAPNYTENGKVYSDAAGNTFERHKAGDRLCQFFVQGELRKEAFVSGKTPEETKAKCDILALKFQSGLTPVTEEK